MSDFGMRLAAERDRLGYTQRAFGEVGGVQSSTQSNYEKGIRQPDMEYLARISRLGVDLVYLLSGMQAAPESATFNPGAQDTGDLGNRLAFERARKGLTQRSAAEVAGVSVSSYAGYEKESGNPPASVLTKLGRAGFDVQFILTGVHGQTVDPSSYNLVVPLELKPLFDAWLHLYISRRLDSDTAKLWAELVNRLNHAIPSASTAQKAGIAIDGEVGQVVSGDVTNAQGVTFNVGGRKR